MVPHHLLMVTTKVGRRKGIITTEGAGEGGREGEVGEDVATTEVAGVVATAMIMVIVLETGTTRSKMNTMMSPRNMPLPLAVGVAEEEGVLHLGVGEEAVGQHAAAEVATISRDLPHAKWVC